MRDARRCATTRRGRSNRSEVPVRVVRIRRHVPQRIGHGQYFAEAVVRVCSGRRMRAVDRNRLGKEIIGLVDETLRVYGVGHGFQTLA